MSESPARLTGRVTVHPRGFGFLNLEGPEGEWAACVAPPDLNPFLDGDRVSEVVTVVEGGRASASALTLVERRRAELFGRAIHIREKSFTEFVTAVGISIKFVARADAQNRSAEAQEPAQSGGHDFGHR